ncbi:hypothetical protein CYY_008240 [Polysphondylium violaceum]|uniref:Nucleoporin n=1 Tax=Polysphondylium violaceum TaxID=133409 RepID=A0A8J4PNP2_9MYCE|nr:hypothetical protein CYY_008240 [Polysphondylium violaceum]
MLNIDEIKKVKIFAAHSTAKITREYSLFEFNWNKSIIIDIPEKEFQSEQGIKVTSNEFQFEQLKSPIISQRIFSKDVNDVINFTKSHSTEILLKFQLTDGSIVIGTIIREISSSASMGFHDKGASFIIQVDNHILPPNSKINEQKGFITIPKSYILSVTPLDSDQIRGTKVQLFLAPKNGNTGTLSYTTDDGSNVVGSNNNNNSPLCGRKILVTYYISIPSGITVQRKIKFNNKDIDQLVENPSLKAIHFKIDTIVSWTSLWNLHQLPIKVVYCGLEKQLSPYTSIDVGESVNITIDSLSTQGDRVIYCTLGAKLLKPAILFTNETQEIIQAGSLETGPTTTSLISRLYDKKSAFGTPLSSQTYSIPNSIPSGSQGVILIENYSQKSIDKSFSLEYNINNYPNNHTIKSMKVSDLLTIFEMSAKNLHQFTFTNISNQSTKLLISVNSAASEEEKYKSKDLPLITSGSTNIFTKEIDPLSITKFSFSHVKYSTSFSRTIFPTMLDEFLALNGIHRRPSQSKFEIIDLKSLKKTSAQALKQLVFANFYIFNSEGKVIMNNTNFKTNTGFGQGQHQTSAFAFGSAPQPQQSSLFGGISSVPQQQQSSLFGGSSSFGSGANSNSPFAPQQSGFGGVSSAPQQQQQFGFGGVSSAPQQQQQQQQPSPGTTSTGLFGAPVSSNIAPSANSSAFGQTTGGCFGSQAFAPQQAPLTGTTTVPQPTPAPTFKFTASSQPSASPPAMPSFSNNSNDVGK